MTALFTHNHNANGSQAAARRRASVPAAPAPAPAAAFLGGNDDAHPVPSTHALFVASVERDGRLAALQQPVLFYFFLKKMK